MTPPGAVISGRLADSILGRLPVLSRNLGPVAACSKRLASRYANTLRAGWPAGDWAELAQARLIFLQVPHTELDPVLARLRHSIDRWENRILVLLDDGLDCGALRPAASDGACVASLSHLQIGQGDLVFVEGGAEAVSALRRLLGQEGVRMIHLRPGDKSIYSAGVNLGRLVSTALMDCVVRTLRHAGVDATTSRRIAEWIADRSVEEVLARGNSSLVSRRLPVSLVKPAQMEALCVRDERTGRFARQLMAAAADFFREDHTAVSTSPRLVPAKRGRAAGL